MIIERFQTIRECSRKCPLTPGRVRDGTPGQGKMRRTRKDAENTKKEPETFL
jgi:hypothetical protein